MGLDRQGRLAQAGNAQVGRTSLSYGPGAEADSEPNQVRTHQTLQVHERAQAQATQTLSSRAWGGYARLVRWRDTTPLPVPHPQEVAQTATQGDGTSNSITQALLRNPHDTLGRQTLHQGPAGQQRLVYDSLGSLVQVPSPNAQPVAKQFKAIGK